MRRLEISDTKIMRMAIQQEIQRSEEARYDHKLHRLLMVCSGLSCYEVADLLGHSPRTVQGWVNRFELKGFAGLEEKQRPGRPKSLDSKITTQIGKDLRRSPRELGYEQNLWDGKLLSHHLAKRYDVDLGIRQCQRLFHELGFRRRKPRPVIAKSDPALQSRFKKTSGTIKKEGC